MLFTGHRLQALVVMRHGVVMRRALVVAVLRLAALEVGHVHGGDADATLLLGVVRVRVVQVLTCQTHTHADTWYLWHYK